MARQRKEGMFINCKVKQEIFDRLDEYSKESMVPKTAIVEKAVEEYLDRVCSNGSGERRTALGK